MMNIDVKKSNKIALLYQKAKDRMEDVFFKIILLLPEKMIPLPLIEKYVCKRENELKAEQVKQTWKIIELEKAVKQINKGD